MEIEYDEWMRTRVRTLERLTEEYGRQLRDYCDTIVGLRKDIKELKEENKRLNNLIKG